MKTVDGLTAYLKTLPDTPANHKVAVASLIFTAEDKVILIERGTEARDSVGLLD